MSLWNSETGNLIQEETLPQPVSTQRLTLNKFQIEGNHLVLLLYGGYEGDAEYVLIYELDKVLAGEEAMPRDFCLEHVERFSIFSKLLVDKTSVNVTTGLGSMVKLDFWSS